MYYLQEFHIIKLKSVTPRLLTLFFSVGAQIDSIFISFCNISQAAYPLSLSTLTVPLPLPLPFPFAFVTLSTLTKKKKSKTQPKFDCSRFKAAFKCSCAHTLTHTHTRGERQHYQSQYLLDICGYMYMQGYG